ncbi:MAG: hypothetical protein H5U04_09970 [Firmicutes bacterium]|nr:hypothetical protein [Bacillota bacterium]
MRRMVALLGMALVMLRAGGCQRQQPHRLPHHRVSIAAAYHVPHALPAGV